MESKEEAKEEGKSEVQNIEMNDLIDKLIPIEYQAILTDYYINTLFRPDIEFTKGLTKQDYDIILSSLDAEDQEIFHSLNICNCKYDPNTPASKKIIHYEQLEKIMTNFLKFKNEREAKYKENPSHEDFAAIYMHAYPMLRQNLQFDINSITFKEVKKNNETNKYEVIDHKIEKLKPEDKDLIYFVSFKLNGKKHKWGKIEQLLEQFEQNNLKEFWNIFKMAYFIFCIDEEKNILTEYEQFPDFLKKAIDNNAHAKFIFFVDPPGEAPEQTMNIFKTSEFEKDYYFTMNKENIVYKADSMLCSGDIVENTIQRNKDKKEYSKEEKIKALYDFYNFVHDIKNYKYNFFFAYHLEVCFKYDKEDNLYISYVNFSHLICELRTKEYEIMKRCADIFKPDMVDINLIRAIDIPIDFNQNNCKVCKKQILDNEDMYYCYKCKEKYCTNCVMKNFNENQGLKKFIDPEHNLLYFKTRDLEQFKNIEEFKLGKDSFANCKDEKLLGNHSMVCNGCGELKNYVKPRYLCLSCRPGIKQDDGFADYCLDCVEHMNKNDEKGKKIQEAEFDLFNQETRFFYEDKTKVRHEHNKHIYLMIALEYKEQGKNPYYDF